MAGISLNLRFSLSGDTDGFAVSSGPKGGALLAQPGADG
jgi:hypothetical protein